MNDAHLSHQCPQCGAPVELEETDRIFSCPFCKVRLFIHAHGPLRYHLKPRIEHAGTLIYVPYWRFRGNAYVLETRDMRHKILDSSLLAVANPVLPPSLGLRTQAIPLAFVEPDTPGLFMEPTVKSSQFKARLLKGIPGLAASTGPSLTACVGDVLSLISLPVFQDTHLVDGLTGKVLGPAGIDASTLSRAGSHLNFASTLCPQCGWDLVGDRQSLVQTCPHCDTAWEPGPEGGRRVTPHFLQTDARPALYMPFWNLRIRARGFRLQTWADLIRLTNLPRALLPWMETTAFSFRVPAFKIRPELFLNLSAQVSLFQPSAPEQESLPRVPLHPVTLPRDEAFQALPVVLGRLAPARKNLFPRIRGGAIRPLEARIEYLPFEESSHEYIQPDMNMAIQKRALFWSKAL
jgi:DNA-directed RNA polymerase subunit RPC12/RpoP